MAANSPTIVGKALYLELRRENYTNQIIITPEGLTPTGAYVPMTTYRRRISDISPRKTWKQMSSMFYSVPDEASKIPQLGEEHALATFADRMSYNKNLFEQLVNGHWTIFKTPITVEVTAEDLEDVRSSKTPYKILARITRSRRKLGFPEDLYTTS